MRRATIACSSRSLALRSSCSPRWSSTAGSALRRVVPASATVWRAGAVAAHEQLRARADEGELGRADAPAVAGREGLAQGAEHGAGSCARGRVHAHLARQHDLLELAGPDALDRAAPPPARSATGGAAPATRGALRRGRGRAAASTPARARRAARARARPAPRAPRRPRPRTLTVRRASPRWRASETSGSTSEAGASERPLRACAAVVRRTRSRPRTPARPRPAVGVARRVVGEGPPAEVARAHGHLAEAPGPARLERDRAARARRARSRRGRAARSRRSGRRRRRARSTTAERSSSAAIGTVTAASAGARSRRARSTAALDPLARAARAASARQLERIGGARRRERHVLKHDGPSSPRRARRCVGHSRQGRQR